MGMFDDVTCHYPVDGFETPFHFQTKEFDCEMNRYEITAGGHLFQTTMREEGSWNVVAIRERIEYHGDLWVRGQVCLRFTEGAISRVIYPESAT